jgi:hypothetical protein
MIACRNLAPIWYFQQLRAWKPHGRRSGPVRHQLRMRLPAEIHILDDGREVLADRRHRPLLERLPGHAIGAPTNLTRDEMWARSRSEVHLDGPVERRFFPTEDEHLEIAERALRYFGIECDEDARRAARELERFTK